MDCLGWVSKQEAFGFFCQCAESASLPMIGHFLFENFVPTRNSSQNKRKFLLDIVLRKYSEYIMLIIISDIFDLI